MNRARLRIRSLRGSLLVALLLLFLPAALSAKTLTIQNFRSEVVVLPDGTISVSETIQAHFAGQWNGVYRTIPVEYIGTGGFNYTLELHMDSITDDSGEKLRFETNRQQHYLKFKIYVPGANDATRTIVLHYRVYNGLRFFEDHDELYWNVTGDEWDVPIQAAEADVSLPVGTTGVRVLDFTGAYGSRARNANVETSGNLVVAKTTQPLAFHEGLTIVVGWDKGAVHEPTWAENAARFLRSNWPLVVPIFAFVGMFYIWYTRGRDPRLKPISVQYEPPDKLTPGEMGTLVDCSANMRDITATLVDLAVRGYIVIEEKNVSHMMGLYSNKDYTFHLKKKLSEWGGLKSHELLLLHGIFVSDNTVSVDLSELHNRFYTNVKGIQNSLLDSLVEHNYFARRPDSVRAGWLGVGGVTGFFLIFGGVWLSKNFGMQPLPFFLAGIATAVVVCAFGWAMPVHTLEGAQALENALGFEEFLQRVESDRMERVEKTPELFEKFLPFAMALGVEKKWVGAFQGIFTQPPSWYQGGVYGPNFYPMMLVTNLNTMTAQTASVMMSAPRSAGGSGFGGGAGGGGFSGGGFGGGGGGGF